MKILGVSGSPAKRESYSLLANTLKEIEEKADTELIHIADYDLELCQGCNYCLKEEECKLDDDLEKLADKLLAADGFIFSAPSYYGTVPGGLKNFMDRTRYLKMQGHKLQNKPLGAVATSGLMHGGGQSTLETIYRFGLTNGMLIVGPAGSPKMEANMVVGTNQQGGSWGKIEDDNQAVELAANLGRRMVNLLARLN